jgi:hypothetical protein
MILVSIFSACMALSILGIQAVWEGKGPKLREAKDAQYDPRYLRGRH